MILIVANRRDAHTRWVVQRLKEMGARVAVFDTEEVPGRLPLSAWIGEGEPRMLAGDLDLSEVRTVWLRRLAKMKADPDLSEEDAQFAVDEAKSMVSGLAQLLSDRFWINPVHAAMMSDRGHGKLVQIEQARQLGLAVPRTVATNDPEVARAFVRSCPGGAIYKPFVSPTRKVRETEDVVRYGTVYTNRIDAQALERLDSVRLTPCTFQEEIPKRCDLRVIVMGDHVFATEIHSQVDERSALDFRRHYALGETPYAAHELPDEVAERCVALCRSFDLIYGAIDLVYTPDDRHVFLEVNQQGQFLWLELQTGQPLLDHFCQLLIQGRPDFSCDAELHEPGLPELPDLDDDD
jgi:glutathione synthase/RimK-type ligase-like ATP-grasp enzyme